MEPQNEPLRPSVPGKPQKPENELQEKQQFRKKIEPEFKTWTTVRKNYARETCVVLGIVFITIGLIGYVIPYLLEAHLSPTHNLIHVITGALAIWFGVKSENAAKKFCFIGGTFYTLLGIVGFSVGLPGMATVANNSEDPFIWKIAPEVLELGTTDHIIHIVAGAAFVCAGFLVFRKKEILEK